MNAWAGSPPASRSCRAPMRIRYPGAAADLREHYTATGERDTEEAGYRLAHLDAFFTPYRRADIGPGAVTRYIVKRQGEASGSAGGRWRGAPAGIISYVFPGKRRLGAPTPGLPQGMVNGLQGGRGGAAPARLPADGRPQHGQRWRSRARGHDHHRPQDTGSVARYIVSPADLRKAARRLQFRCSGAVALETRAAKG
jgi:hypothetical protein